MFRKEFKQAEIQANHENKGMYVTFMGEKTFIEPNLPELTMTEVDERLRMLAAAAVSKKKVRTIGHNSYITFSNVNHFRRCLLQPPWQFQRNTKI